ncbi:unnamed protein product [Allacma fusca]|uniref:Uncharacterized protein n=1 Tax=Allacma fusca TaxID=39272 RepID=A0A8J2L101_9HEXA|nr:unnamed protein product [Allacma fusca]
MDIATNYTLGKSTESLSNFQNGYAKATHDELTYVSHRLVTPWLWADSLWKISKTGRNEKATRTFLQNFFDKVSQNRAIPLRYRW